MKTIQQVQADEQVSYVGDITIDGNIGKNSKIHIQDGSLIVNGDVESEAEIIIKTSKVLDIQSKFSSHGLSNRGIISNGISIGTHGLNGEKHTISANQSLYVMDTQMYIGNVNIDNRILTDGQVKVCGKDTYEITAASPGLFSALYLQSPNEPVKATIDNLVYYGKLIRVEGKKVIVDEKVLTGNLFGSSVPTVEKSINTSRIPPQLCIKGIVRDNVKINSDVAIKANNIGSGCKIISAHQNITAADIGPNTNISVHGEINIQNAGEHVSLTSTQYGISAKSIGNRASILVRETINVEDIGDFCNITSQQYGITARNIGPETQINVRDTVTVQDIASSAQITSEMDGVTAKNISNKVQIYARNGIKLQSVGDTCIISSSQYGIEVKEFIGAYSELIARDEIIVGSLCNNTKLTSHQNKVKVFGKSGNHVTITARDSIHLKDLGECANIHSSYGDVEIRNIGINATINARDSIDIDGTCPNPNSLNLIVGNGGRIRRPQQAIVIPKTSNVGMFAQKTVAESKAEEEIPEDYLCPINMTIMDKPTFCLLDGRTYNEDAIHNWLTMHRCSPMNQAHLAENQKIESVLHPNFGIKSAIAEWLSKHPECPTIPKI